MKSLLSLLLFFAFFSAQAITNRAPEFTLEDQFSKEYSSKGFEGKNVVYIITDRAGADYVENWTKSLSPFKSKVNFVTVANVKGVPGLLKGFIRGKSREVYSHSVLMDWEAKLWEYCQCKDSVPTVVFVDNSGEFV